MGRSSFRARRRASSPHGYQSTGLPACWRRYGLVASARRFGVMRTVSPAGSRVAHGPGSAERARLSALGDRQRRPIVCVPIDRGLGLGPKRGCRCTPSADAGADARGLASGQRLQARGGNRIRGGWCGQRDTAGRKRRPDDRRDLRGRGIAGHRSRHPGVGPRRGGGDVPAGRGSGARVRASAARAPRADARPDGFESTSRAATTPPNARSLSHPSSPSAATDGPRSRDPKGRSPGPTR
jgi:hypothetical protein